MNECKCKKPTIIIPRQWTVLMPPSGIPPEPIYMCSVCGLEKPKIKQEETNHLNNKHNYMKITKREFTDLENFLRHTKKVLGTEQKLPMSLRHKSSTLEIEFKVKRHGEQ